MNGDSKIIYDAVATLQKSITALVGQVAATKTAGDTRHEANIRTLENMAGDMTICRTSIQNLKCGAESKRIDANEKNLSWLRNFTIGGVLLFIVGAAVKTWLL